MTITTLLPWLSLVVGLIAITRFYFDRWDRAVEEGKMQNEFTQLRKDLDACHLKIRDMENDARMVDIDLAEVKSDVKHILAALGRIEDKLEKK